MPHRPLVSRKLNVRSFSADPEERTGVFTDEIQQEAREVLEKVGWASPMDDGEMTSEDPFVKQIDAGIQADYGFGLDDLLNPAKVCVSFGRKIGATIVYRCFSFCFELEGRQLGARSV